ncbi:histidine kinase dimerization/phospho-acceptor domain-containing protein [Paraclostridium bifermentans]|nr:histidine kinase dimerization/phospho-acceptor domain-containing protein [Paraclostridium bifermentans]
MKTELISNVSHDLKTPLTSIITYVDLLKDEN